MFKRFYLSLVALLGLCGAVAVGNYTMTQGAGTSFGSVVIGGTVHYAQQLLCDLTTPAQCAAVSAAGAVKVDGSAVTQPVSLTSTTITGTVAATQSGTWTVQPGNTANTTAWLVNVGAINGVTPLMGNGATGTGSQRVTIANDNTLPTGWPTSTQVQTVTTWAGGTLGAMAAYGTSPGAVLVPGANVFVTNTLAAVGNNADDIAAAAANSSPVVSYNYVWDAVGGNWDRQPKSTTVANPCETVTQSYTPISITTATTTRIVAPSASNKTYICMLFLTSAAADNVGIVEGTGGTCGTGTAGVVGGTTAANGPNFAANGGMLLQAGGKVAAAQTAGTNVDLCLITSAATPLAGGIKYVQAP